MKQPAGDGVQELFESDEDVEGPVVQWLARDSRDHVALFTAAGASDVSRIVLDELDAHRRALGAILCSAPTTRSVFDPAVGKAWGSRWGDVVERGLFVFVAYRPSGPFLDRGGAPIPAGGDRPARGCRGARGPPARRSVSLQAPGFGDAGQPLGRLLEMQSRRPVVSAARAHSSCTR